MRIALMKAAPYPSTRMRNAPLCLLILSCPVSACCARRVRPPDIIFVAFEA